MRRARTQGAAPAPAAPDLHPGAAPRAPGPQHRPGLPEGRHSCSAACSPGLQPLPGGPGKSLGETAGLGQRPQGQARRQPSPLTHPKEEAAPRSTKVPATTDPLKISPSMRATCFTLKYGTLVFSNLSTENGHLLVQANDSCEGFLLLLS